jgi:hypothetical protein
MPTVQKTLRALHATARPHWKLILAITVGAAIAIMVVGPAHNALQSASSVRSFRRSLRHPTSELSADLFDVVFAAGYGLLGLIGFYSVARNPRIARLGALLVVVGASCDEAEKVVLAINITCRATITDTWISVMRVPGTVKWLAAVGIAWLYVLVIRGGVRRLWQGSKGSSVATPVRSEPH